MSIEGDGTSLIADSEFVENLSGLYGLGALASQADTTVDDCLFERNMGGALMITQPGGRILSSSFIENKQDKTMINRVEDFIDCLFIRNDTFLPAYPETFLGYGATTIDGCLFEENQGAGAVFSAQTIVDSDFIGNNADWNGGAVYYAELISNCTFSGNTATSGGAVYTAETIQDSVFVDNHGGNGGAVNTAVTIQNTVFKDNRASSGGAVYQADTLQDSLFIGNVASGSGGGVYEAGKISNSIFAMNEAEYYAVGIADVGYNVVMTNNFGARTSDFQDAWNAIVVGNQCDRVTNWSTVTADTIQNSIIAGNAGDDCDLRLTNFASNVTIVGNQTTCRADIGLTSYETYGLFNSILDEGIIAEDGIVTIEATTQITDVSDLFVGYPLLDGTWTDVRYNEETYQTELTMDGAGWADDAHAGLFVHADRSQPLWSYIASNDSDTLFVWGNLAEDFNPDDDITTLIETEDRFNIYDLHLKAGSPCIDSGTDKAAPYYDFEGRLRHDDPEATNIGIGSSWIDRGAYEYGDDVSHPDCGTPLLSDDQEKFYWYCQNPLDWDAARAYCETLGWQSRMVTVIDPEEFQLMNTIAPPFWIGMSEGASEGSWSWFTGETPSPTSDELASYWMESRPYINPAYQCALTDTSHLWRDEDCSVELPFVCETEPDPFIQEYTK